MTLYKHPCLCGDLIEKSEPAQATISQHLKELKSVGLIKGSMEGGRTCYCLNAKKWKPYRKLVEAFFADYENKKFVQKNKSSKNSAG